MIMKCQKCGRNEVNFHYSSSINGCVTETHLCSECAAESGYDIGQMFDVEGFFGETIPMLSGFSGFVPIAIPGKRTNHPFTMRPRVGMIDQGTSCNCGCEKASQVEMNVEISDEMRERRELNMQLRIAVENEEFEKAAELRDRIKELEGKV
jgi:protein arginine kinase activator